MRLHISYIVNRSHSQGSFRRKQNELIFTVQRRAARDFWFVKLNSSLRALTFNAEVLSLEFSLLVFKGTVMLCSLQYPL